uniref:PEP-utilising enzyme, mobile domain n=1 Tax=Candidatus Kentrum sp. DK TaxID=2126562 RepID=A0A450S275_9GAMM|nr:MAG: PEP-utilising enzyme, mobile domain [Candidatus Kentron sp. DK]
MKIDYIKNLDPIREELGGKGYYLSLLHKNNIKIPNGFIIPSRILPDKKAYQEEIPDLFDSLGCQYVSVRSSASNEDSETESLAGLYRSFLFVNRDRLLDKIQECHEYYLNNAGDEKTGFAIIVQEMIDGEISGVCFTSNPLTGEEQYVIEACYGLCDGLVSGRVTPVRWHIDSSGKINETARSQNIRCAYNFEQEKIQYVEMRAGEFVGLERSQLIEIIEYAKRIKSLLGCDVDIEWCIRKPDVLYILQARPITSAGRKLSESQAVYRISYRETDTIWSQDLGVRARVESPYRFNRFRDVLRFSDGTEFITLISDADRKDTENYSASFYSDRKYLDAIFAEISQDYRQQNRLFNEWKDIDYTILAEDEIRTILDKMISVVLKANRFYEITGAEYTTPLLKGIRAQLGEYFDLLAEPFESDLIDQELIDWYGIFLDLDGDYRKDLLYNHISKHPWLCWGMISYDEIDDYLRNRWRITREESGEINRILGRKKNDRVSRNTLKSELINSRFIHMKDAIELMHRISLARMKIKNGWAGIFRFILPLIDEVARRTNIPSQIVHKYYRVDEITALLMKGKRLADAVVQERKDNVLWHGNRFYQGQEARTVLNTLNIYSGSEIKGEVAYPGNVKGNVYLWDGYCIENIEKLGAQLDRIRKEKYIFVCSMAQPSITQYFPNFHGIITEEGGILSHAAIIARERKIPCIVGVGNIMKKVEHLQEITMFSDGGVSM